MRDSSTGKVGSRTYYFLLSPMPVASCGRRGPPTRPLGTFAAVSDPETPPAEELEQPIDRSPHSARYIALRVLGGAAVIGVAFVVQRHLAQRRGRPGDVRRQGPEDRRRQQAARPRPCRSASSSRAGSPTSERGLLVFLHGRGEDERSYLVDPMFEALADLRDRAPVVAFPYGGAELLLAQPRQRAVGRLRPQRADPEADPPLRHRPAARSRSAASRWAASAPTTSPGSRRSASARSAATRRRSGRAPPRPPTAPSTTPPTSTATTSSRPRS